nr:hypothetical protein HK105_000204 [Polyrhizophydium stewartii]
MEARSTRLSFKGEGVKKKKKAGKKRKALDGPDAASGSQAEGWVDCESIDDVRGPVVIATAVLDPPSLLRLDDKTPKVVCSHLKLGPGELSAAKRADGQDSDGDDDAAAATVVPATMATIEPLAAIQVFQARRLPDSTKITFLSAHDKYLSSDRFGAVACELEAAGPAEEWDLVVRDDGFAFQNMRGLFLTAMDDGSVRADADSVGFKQIFRIKCQAANKSKALGKRAGAGTELLDPDAAAALEREQLKKFQTSASLGGRYASTLEEDRRALVKASRQGTLNEELLLRRAKTKSDKYCK